MDIFSKEFNNNINNFVGKMIDDTEKKFNSGNIEEQFELTNLIMDYLRRLGRSLDQDYSDVIPLSFELLYDRSKIKVLKDCLNKGLVIEKSKVYISCLEDNYEEKKTDDFVFKF